MIIAENLTKNFVKTEKNEKTTTSRSFCAVNNVSLQANDGEVLGILGPNGAGKTTLLRMLGGMMQPSGGKIRYFLPDKIPIVGEIEVKRNIGYLSNNTKLYPRLSVREILLYMGDLYGYTAGQAAERAENIIDILSIADFADNRIEKLSTGQTQRASIARCLFADPMLYILDEPTLGLDIMSAAAIVEFMKGEQEKGKTIIYSTHYLEEAELLCNKVLLLNNGKVIAFDTPKNLCVQTGTDTLRAAFSAVIGKETAI